MYSFIDDQMIKEFVMRIPLFMRKEVDEMTIEEASQKYNIPIKILKEYESWNLCQDVKKVIGSWQYDDSDIERLSVIMTLHDIGFTSEEIERFMNFMILGDSGKKECLMMLNKKRTGILDEVHLGEKKIFRLDYLRYEINKQ